MDRGARVVDEARKRQLRGTGAAAYLVGGLVEADGTAAPAELDRRGKPVRPAAHDDRVERHPVPDPPVRRRRAQRAGAVTVPTAMLTAALCRTLPAYFHWRRLSTQTLRDSTTGDSTPRVFARFSSVRSQNRSFARFAPKM